MSGDQTAKRVQRQASDLGFDAAFVQFFYDAGTPFTAKSAARITKRIAIATTRRARRTGGVCAEGRTCVGSRTTGMRDSLSR